MPRKGRSASEFLIGVVDDHIQTAVSISNTLEGEGFRTFQVYTADEAIEKAKQEKPDLMLVDLLMQGKGGLEVVKVLSRIKIFAIVSNGDNPEGIDKKNIRGVLRKPIGNMDMIRKIKSFLRIS